MNTKTGAGLVAWARRCVSSGDYVYCYGTYCNKFTESKYSEKRRQYPTHYTAKRHEQYVRYIQEGKIATDCVGLIKGFLWELNGSIKYRRDNIPDLSAHGMYNACKKRGKVSQGIPDVPGLLVFNAALTHVGIYDGKGRVLEAQSFAKGLRDTPLTKRADFTLWGYCPFIIYGSSDAEHSSPDVVVSTPATETNGEGVNNVPTIKNKSVGVAVQICQRLLIANGYSLPRYGIDGDYGSETVEAVRKFQKDRGLTIDGICGPKTWAELARI